MHLSRRIKYTGLKRYFFHIGYNGAPYRGWQRQAKAVNIQEVIEKTLSGILKTDLTIIGCGRTDAQVHASQFFFHVDIPHEWDFDLIFRINKMLPDGISVFDIIPVADLAHARFDATERTYDYFIHTYKNPFIGTLSSFYLERNLDVHKMSQAAALLTKYNDYHGMCKSPANYRTTICNVTSSGFLVDDTGDRMRFQISANRFLGSMVRILVGRLLEIGKGELSVDEFENYLITRETPPVIKPAYPQGLYLSKVTYPYLDVAPRNQFSSILQGDWLIVNN